MREKYFSPDNLKNYSVEEWLKILHNDFSNTYQTTVYGRNPNILYRARLNYNCKGEKINQFNDTKDLWAPPIECVKKINRCNHKNESILYCSVTQAGSVYEARPEKGSTITIMKYTVSQEIYPFALVGYNAIAEYNLNYGNSFKNHFENTPKNIIELDNHIADIYRSFDSADLPIYNLTNAIFQTYTYQPIENFPRIKGILYPSVQSEELNFAFIPDLVKPLIKPSQAEIYEVILSDDEKYGLKKTFESNVFQSESEINWNEIKNSSPIYLKKVYRNS